MVALGDSTAVITDLSVSLIDPITGAYSVTGNFDELREGEVATVTFRYTATDSQGTTSDEGTITLNVTGTDEAATFTQIGTTLTDYSDIDDGSIDLSAVSSGSVNKIELIDNTSINININDVLRLTDVNDELIISSEDGDASDQVVIDTNGLTKEAINEIRGDIEYNAYTGIGGEKLLIEIHDATI